MKRSVPQSTTRSAWVPYNPLSDIPADPRTIVVHEDEPTIDTGVLDKDGNMIRRRMMRRIGFVHHGEG